MPDKQPPSLFEMLVQDLAIERAGAIITDLFVHLHRFYQHKEAMLVVAEALSKEECGKECKLNCEAKNLAMLQFVQALIKCFPDLREPINALLTATNESLQATNDKLKKAGKGHLTVQQPFELL